MKKLLFFIFLISNSLAVYGQAGSNDLTFNSDRINYGFGPNSIVLKSELQQDGKLLVVGDFTTFNGISNNRIVRLNEDGSLDKTFDCGTGANLAIRTVAVQPDGKILIGGAFSTFNGFSINSLARLNIDGSLDTEFNPGFEFRTDGIYSILVQPDGKIIIGGGFNSIDGVEKRNIARLNLNGTLDNTFTSGIGVDSQVLTIVRQSDNKILLGGNFTSYNGIPRNRITRINEDGSIDLTFDPGTGANSTVETISIQPDGNILLGGWFTSFNGVNKNRVARIFVDGNLDNSFNTGNGANNIVKTIALLPNNKIVVGGLFTTFNNTTNSRYVQLDMDGNIDSFNNTVNINNMVYGLTIQSDGKILVVGSFTEINNLGIKFISRLNNDSTLDTTFNPITGADDRIWISLIQSDGKIVIGGGFKNYDGYPRSGISRLMVDGSLDQSFNIGTGCQGIVYAMSIQPDGKILIGGSFSSYNGVLRNNIARLNQNGSLDNTFDPGTGIGNSAFSSVRTLTLQPDGKIIVGGGFSSYNGTLINSIARLNSDGSLDDSFIPGSGANNTVWTSVLQPDGKILIGGSFGSFNGLSRIRIARLNPDGSLDTSFDPGSGANNTIYSIGLQSDNKVIIGGQFTSYNRLSINRIARLNLNGTLDGTFNPGTGASNTIFTLGIQADDKILAAGDFSSFSVFLRNKIVRLIKDGNVDTTFDPGEGANITVSTIAIQANGKILVGGDFTSYDNVSRVRITRLLNDIGSDEDNESPKPDLSNLPQINAQCQINFDELTIPTATDNVDGIIQGSTDQVFPITSQGTTTINWTFTDAAGNTNTQTQDIVVLDTELPNIQSGPDIQIDTELNSCLASVNIPFATAADNCSVGIPTGIRSDGFAINDPYPVGPTTITWTVSDINGNSAIPVVQTITVIDNQAPVISTNQDQNLTTEPGTCTVNFEATATATDNCSVITPTGIRSDGLPLDAPYSVGPTSITWTVSDINGIPATPKVQTITVTDNQAPVISINGNQDLSAEPGVCTANFEATATATDNCSVGTPTGIRSDGLALDAQYPIGTTTITWSVSDANGNPAEPVIQTITVVDNELPIVIVKNILIELRPGESYSLNTEEIDNGSSDNCEIASKTLNKTLFDEEDEGENPVALTIIDQSGNESSATATVTVIVTRDADCVVARARDLVLVLDRNGSASIRVNQVDDGSLTNCSNRIVSRELEKSIFTCADLGEQMVGFKAIDRDGNIGETQFKVTVLDETAPSIGNSSKINISLASNEIYILPDLRFANAASDNCSVVEYIQVPEPGTVYNSSGTYQILLRAIDGSGNLGERSVTLSIRQSVNSRLLLGNESSETNTLSDEQKSIIPFESNKMKIYPNPAIEITNVQVSLIEPSTVEIRIFDTAGRLVFREESLQEDSFVRSIQLGSLSTGLYHVVVRVNHQYLQGRLIKR